MSGHADVEAIARIGIASGPCAAFKLANLGPNLEKQATTLTVGLTWAPSLEAKSSEGPGLPAGTAPSAFECATRGMGGLRWAALNLLRVMLLSLSLSSTRGFIINAGVVTSSPLSFSALSSSGPSLLRVGPKISGRGHLRACPGGVQALSMVLFDLPGGREVISYYESTRPCVPGVVGRLLSRIIAPLAALWMFLLFLSIKVGVPPVRLLEYSGAAWSCRTPPQLIYRTRSLEAGTKNTLQPNPPMLPVQTMPKTAPTASETTNSPPQLPSTEAAHGPEHELAHSPPADGGADGGEGQHPVGKATAGEAAAGEVAAGEAEDSAMPAIPSVGAHLQVS